MTPQQTTVERMISVKATCIHAPTGLKKAAALKHYRAAEIAQMAQNDTETNQALDAATRALA